MLASWCLTVCAFVFSLTLQARKQNSCCEVMWCCCLVLMDTPLSAFLLFLQLPSRTHHAPATSSQHKGWTLPNPRWDAGMITRKGGRWWQVYVWPIRIWTDGSWRSDWVWSGVELTFELFLTFQRGEHLFCVSVLAEYILVWRSVSVMCCLQTIYCYSDWIRS